MKILIGYCDSVDFPTLELENIDVKIDSGAYTSSLHCHNFEIVDKKLLCQFLDPAHDKYHEKVFTFSEFKRKKVKSSNGQVENRFLISSEIRIFNQIFPIELTLSERGSMNYPVLLGRKFLKSKFIVDCEKKNLSAKNKIIQMVRLA
jgi:hypothetical protein